MINPFERAQVLFEAKSKLSSAIETLTKGKSRKYVTYSQLKKHMGLDDSMFDEVVTSAQKANRHSNKYVFTNVDDEPAIGVAATKRKKATPQGAAHDVSTKDDVINMYDAGSGKDRFTGTPGPIPATYMMKEHRETELWTIYNRHGWRGLDRAGLLPEGWQSMSGTQIVETILAKEFPATDETNEGVITLRVRQLEKKFTWKGETYIATGTPGYGYASTIRSESGEPVMFAGPDAAPIGLIKKAAELFTKGQPFDEVAESKTPEMEKSLDDMSRGMFGRQRTDVIKDHKCVACGGSASSFKDALSKKEYSISGLCQKCQDKIFEEQEVESTETVALRDQFNELKTYLKVTSYYNPDLHMRLFNMLKNKSVTTKQLMSLPSWVVYRNMTDEMYMPPDQYTGNANDKYLAPEDFSRACLQLVVTLVVLGRVDDLTFMKANKMMIPKEVKDFMDQYDYAGVFISDEHLIQNMLKYPSNVKFKFGTYATTLKNLELDWLDIII